MTKKKYTTTITCDFPDYKIVSNTLNDVVTYVFTGTGYDGEPVQTSVTGKALDGVQVDLSKFAPTSTICLQVIDND